jgi:hypothetical protein
MRLPLRRNSEKPAVFRKVSSTVGCGDASNIGSLMLLTVIARSLMESLIEASTTTGAVTDGGTRRTMISGFAGSWSFVVAG